ALAPRRRRGGGGYRARRPARQLRALGADRLDRLVAQQQALAAVIAVAHLVAPLGDLCRILALVDREQALEQGVALGHRRDARVEVRSASERLVASDPLLPATMVADPDARAIATCRQRAALPRRGRGVDHDRAIDPAVPHFTVAGALAPVG